MAETDTALITGAASIAKALNLTTSQVYRGRFHGGLKFIFDEPGIGLCTTQAAVAAYLAHRTSGKSVEDAEKLMRLDIAS